MTSIIDLSYLFNLKFLEENIVRLFFCFFNSFATFFFKNHYDIYY